MKGKKKLIFVSLALLIAIVGLITTTVAWLTSTGKSEHTFVMGDVTYTFGSEGTATNKVVVPGENIFAGITINLVNKSTVNTQVRVKVGITGMNSTEDIFITTTDSNWTFDTDSWYYKGKAGIVNKASNTSTGDTINLPLAMKFDGSKVGNTYKGQAYTITLTFESKQAEEVTWDEMGSINFETGLAK